MLKPALILFLKNYFALNNISLDHICYLYFDIYVNPSGSKYVDVEIYVETVGNVPRIYTLDVNVDLVDVDQIDTTKEYTLSELGII